MATTIEQAIKDLQAGKMVVVVDDAGRENEADLVMAAAKVSPPAINFMITQARGLVCLALTAERAAALALPLMTPDNSSKFKTNFTVSIEAAQGISTGISAEDRSRTIAAAINPRAKPEDLARPGHVFPLVSHEHGVLGRPGHTEAAVDLMRLAGLAEAGVICEILDDEGRSARGQDLKSFAATHRLTLISVEDVRRHRLATEALAKRLTTTSLPTTFGLFNLLLYKDVITGQEHLALTLGDVTATDVLCRVHSRCVTGDVFGSRRCDCQQQLHAAMTSVQQTGRGIILYLDQEGRGIGLTKKIAAYALQDQGVDTVEANQQLGHQPDERHYWIAASILKDLGVRSIELLTNNPQKVNELVACGLAVMRRPLAIEQTPDNSRYLRTKKEKLGHWL